MIVGHIGGAGAPYEIQKSLRLRASATAYLNRTPGAASNRKTWTWSGWVKKASIGGTSYMLLSAGASSANRIRVQFEADTLFVLNTIASANTTLRQSTAVFRDPSAWYHLLVVWDTTQATANDRLKLFINGIQLTAFTTTNNVAQNNDGWINNTNAHFIGISESLTAGFDGCIGEINFIDGQALTPTSFGEFNSDGVWVPKKYTGLYGTNGFYLPFSDGSSLANLTADQSGNGNNWTANNVSITAGATYDWMEDTPTNNFAVLNAIYAGRSTLTNGNLTASGTTDLPTIIPDSGTWYFERGGVSQTWTPPAAFPAGTGNYNFGQRPWESTGPTGSQKALCTRNLSAVTIANPRDHFDVVLDTGANIKTTAEAVFPSNFLEWIKDRANANNHQLIDIVRGTSAVLQSNTTAAETTYSAPAGSSVGWVWKADGTPVVNNAGSIQSQVSANVLAGFSIVSYTGTGANGTVGHGLGIVPKLIIIKNRAGGTGIVFHENLPNPATQALYLNTTDAALTSALYWNSTLPTSSVFSLAAYAQTNDNGSAIVAYCFAEIPGFSKIGSYTGNGSADGPFVHCGFRPRYLLIKRTNGTGDWQLVDTARSANNVVSLELNPNLTAAESTLASLDILSNGFKLRATDAGYNANTGTYVFYAIAEQPFNAPSNAR